jgi:EmrB/QacA subfamily drug resistance transporter
MKKTIDNKWWVLIAVGTGSLMSSLDGSVVNIILPVLKDVFKSDVTTVEWIVTVYLLVLSSLLLTFGRLGDLRGHKTVYLWAFGVFIVSSIMCGLAWSTTALIVFRGIQAVGGAMLASNAPAIITGNFPPEQRGRAFGLASTMTYLGLTIGPSLGGWLTEAIGWRAVFYINVPIGSLAMILSLLFIPKDAPSARGQRFDLSGAVAFMAGLTSLMLGLNRGSEWGWDSPLVLGLLALAVIILAGFIWIEKRAKSPMLDLSLFKIPLFSTSTAAAILNYIAIYSIIFLMPFYLIQGRGVNPARAGLILTAQPVIMAVAAPISGSFSDRFGSRKPGMIGMGVLAAGLLLLSRLGPESDLWMVILGLGLAGLGTGMFISPNTSALMGAAPMSHQGIASGVQGTARNFGMVLGIGLAGAIFTTQLAGNAADALFRGTSLGFLAGAAIAVIGVFVSAAKQE